jgi:uncharacterized protein (DUF1499 family)
MRAAVWVFFGATVVKCVLSAALIGLAHTWNHTNGVVFGCGGLVVGAADMLLWWLRHVRYPKGGPKCHRGAPGGDLAASPPEEGAGLLRSVAGGGGSGGDLAPATAASGATADDADMMWRIARGRGAPGALRAVYFFGSLFFYALIVFLVVVHIVAPDPAWKTLPLTCGKQTDNCSIVRPGVSFRAEGRHMVAVPGMVANDAIALSRGWALAKRGTRVLRDENDFLHVRFVSKTWAFPDDFGVLGVAVRNGTWNGTEIWCTSRSRLGKSDFGVNPARVAAFLDFVLAKIKAL